jgi:hypothetical protein
VIHAVGPDLRKGFKHTEMKRVPSTELGEIPESLHIITTEEGEFVDQEVEVLHVDDALTHLTNAYRNIFSEFVKSGTDVLRMLPVSGGIFSGSFKDDMHVLTYKAVHEANRMLTSDEQAVLYEKQIDLCIFSEKDLIDFEQAGFKVRNQLELEIDISARDDNKEKKNKTTKKEFSVKLQPFGVLGIQMTSSGGFVQKGDDPIKMKNNISVCIVDPAGLHHIQPPGGPSGAGGAAGAIYKWLGISNEKTFSEDVIAAVKKTGDAKHHKYFLNESSVEGASVTGNVGMMCASPSSSSSSSSRQKSFGEQERELYQRQIENEKEANAKLSEQLKLLSDKYSKVKEEHDNQLEEISNFKDSSKAIQIAKEMGIKEGENREKMKSEERVEKYKKRVKDCEQLIVQSSNAASLASAAWQSQKVFLNVC